MAKSQRPKLTPEERVQKSLASAAKILNKKIHIEPFAENIALDGEHAKAAVAEGVIIFQVFCPDENKVIGTPTTDRATAQALRNAHNASTGHLSNIISSS